MSEPVDWTIRSEPLTSRPTPVGASGGYPVPAGPAGPADPGGKSRSGLIIGVVVTLVVGVFAFGAGYLTGRHNSPAAASAATTSPTAAPSSAPIPTPSRTPSPSPTAPPGYKPGDTVNVSGVATATFYQYKQPVAGNAPRPATDGYTWGAIDIKVCVTGGDQDAVEVTAEPWVLRYADDTTASPSNIEYNQFPAPRYHFSNVIAKGACLRGWLTFAVPPNKRPTMVEYQPLSLVFDWSVA